MTDVASQREARRLKLMKNAENRMNRLRGQGQGADEEVEGLFSGPTVPKAEPEDIDSKQYVQTLNDCDNEISEPNTETRTTSPYNLRHRTNKASPESSAGSSTSEQKTPSVPYEIVDDPEVPSLAEFLATQKATKAADGKNVGFKNMSFGKVAGDGSSQASRKNWSSEKHIEYVRIAGLFVTALLTRWSLNYKLGFSIFILEILFQNMFFPFLLFEVLIFYIIRTYMQNSSSAPPPGSLLSTALVLCGVQPQLIQMYNGIMGRVTTLSNDFFLYIFAFLMWHAVIGY